ncbi:MAG: hypothetical protein ACI4VQ_06285 [Clostridia bacterium]
MKMISSKEYEDIIHQNKNMKEQLKYFIPRRRVRRVYKQLQKILEQDGIVGDLNNNVPKNMINNKIYPLIKKLEENGLEEYSIELDEILHFLLKY